MIAFGLVIGDASARDAELVGELMLGEASTFTTMQAT